MSQVIQLMVNMTQPFLQLGSGEYNVRQRDNCNFWSTLKGCPISFFPLYVVRNEVITTGNWSYWMIHKEKKCAVVMGEDETTESVKYFFSFFSAS